jgi:hypothetical protein
VLRPVAAPGLALLFALAACAQPGADPSTAVVPSAVVDESEADAAQPSIPITEVPGEVLEAIVADAADRAGVERDEVDITTAEAVTWSDGSLGCPEPGMMYTQALVPGYRVVVQAGGEEMSFHASDRGDFRFCQNPKPPLERNPTE